MTTLHTYYDPSTKKHIKEEYTVDSNGVPNGKYVRYFKGKKGEIQVKCYFRDGEVDGEFVEYYENGKVKTRCSYEKGELNGSFRQYYANGNPALDCYYSHGKLKGRYTEYHHGDFLGQRVACCFYEGQLVGEYKNYYRNGNIHREGTFDKGKLVGPVKVYNKKGKTVGDSSFEDGKDIGWRKINPEHIGKMTKRPQKNAYWAEMGINRPYLNVDTPDEYDVRVRRGGRS